MYESVEKRSSYFEVYYELFGNEKTKSLNSNGIILYSMMANQIGLSKRPENIKKYTDENGQVFILFTEFQAKQKLNISKGTFFKLKKELKKIGLIDYHEQIGKKNGISTPIYVTSFEHWKKRELYNRRIVDEMPDFS
ncbi:replication initiator protein A [Metabacillus idriensis]|uniref:replication initiator protein A n=1 Tax=Metabacillus idriensis TaxID=324768 RepID=UPI00174821B3|nr:replication initiator protein A [Metabacillus idriensis]